MLPLVVRIDDLEAEVSTFHSFPAGPVRLGHNPLNDLVIDHPAIAQFHAEIEFDADGTYYRDLGTALGTVRNNERLPSHETTTIDKQGPLEVGPLRLTF